ncbi:hypothetical protein DE146DRAFT_659789 [Phaeosphaeria sp. MPI-PUGE-AT-0046c]|nr:hypothetical protein DE146DRAFT_659789 [Phaeosphaeria sp. MPI-PUGE-AT-0046c]
MNRLPCFYVATLPVHSQRLPPCTAPALFIMCSWGVIPSGPQDRSVDQHLEFKAQHARLLKPHIICTTPRTYDLGCGPSNPTSALLNAFPNAKFVGIDS